MSFSIGIVGLPNVGKSTLFCALTKKSVDVSNYPFCTIDPNVGVVAAEDPRLHTLAKICESKKIFPTVIEFVDIAGLVENAHQGEGLGNQFLTRIRDVDAILEMVRVFKKDDVVHVSGSVNPSSDVSLIETELALADLDIVNKYQNTCEKEVKAGRKDREKDLALLRELAEFLKRGKPARQYENLSGISNLRELRLLTAKPIIYCMNHSGSNADAKPPQNIQPCISLDVKLECDIAELSVEDWSLLGVHSGISDLIGLSYRVLILITFFTANKNEARTWTIPSNTKIPRAGGIIHSDFEEKFIRADVISIDELIRSGSWLEARKNGRVRSEGKNYTVCESDVIEFK